MATLSSGTLRPNPLRRHLASPPWDGTKFAVVAPNACLPHISRPMMRLEMRSPGTSTGRPCSAMNSYQRGARPPATCSANTSGLRYWTSKSALQPTNTNGSTIRRPKLVWLPWSLASCTASTEQFRLKRQNRLSAETSPSADGKRGPKSVSWSKCPAWTARGIHLCKLPMLAT